MSHLLNYTENHKAPLNYLLDKRRELCFSLELFFGTFSLPFQHLARHTRDARTRASVYKKVSFKLPDVNENAVDVTVIRNVHLYKVSSNLV